MLEHHARDTRPRCGYRKGLDTHLPNAVRVVDHFHVIELANTAIDDARRRVQQVTLEHRGRKGDPLYRGRRVFLTVYEPLSNERLAWMPEILAYYSTSGASNGRIENIHMLAEKTRRNAHGFVNHINYRRQLIGRLGIKWTEILTRRIRGRQPHAAA